MAQYDGLDDNNVMVGDIAPITLIDGKLTEKMAESLGNAVRALIKKVNGGISHGSALTGHRGNIDERFVDAIAPSGADTEFVVAHPLKRLPVGYEVVRRDRACIIYDSSPGSWNDTLIFLKSNVADAAVKLRVF